MQFKKGLKVNIKLAIQQRKGNKMYVNDEMEEDFELDDMTEDAVEEKYDYRKDPDAENKDAQLQKWFLEEMS